MTETRFIYRSDGEWVATLYDGNLFDMRGEWVAWTDGDDVYALDGEYVGYISGDGRLLRKRVQPYRKRRKPPEQRPRFRPPPNAPLAPLFAEISFDIVDVFEETPNVFAVVSELRPDAGEASLPRLLETDPTLAAQHKLHKVKMDLLEEMVYGMIYSYDVTDPPIPIEAMAAGIPPENLGEVKPDSPQERVRLAEQLIKQVGQSAWAERRGYCGPEGFTPVQIQYAARALLLPRHWLLSTPEQMRHPETLARRFCVPQSTATLRLHDLE
jgi:hypothetical protein